MLLPTIPNALNCDSIGRFFFRGQFALGISNLAFNELFLARTIQIAIVGKTEVARIVRLAKGGIQNTVKLCEVMVTDTTSNLPSTISAPSVSAMTDMK